MKGWLKNVAALLLVPLCLSASGALARALLESGRTETSWLAALGGAACWVVIFVTLPKPVWFYVLGHELTHAIWVMLFGGRIKRLKVTGKGGHVIATKSNFLIALAPYFFPFHVCLVILLFAAGGWIWGMRGRSFPFFFALGMAYSFHVTFTVFVLRAKQSDIAQHGRFFSAIVIWLGNALFPLLLIHFLLPGLSLPRISREVVEGTLSIWSALWRHL